ncbi:hypothetical protein MJO52_08855 [Microbulbifer variabilis]|uniref:Uncharacterized protein n=1 Tax=Microbulbifer variabilis TaxID=266805 RepID=A0ABY4VFZ4_9GAMM|nr:hypothetical protein [Microbulbifer variabilis]USD23230.1 hypothetical protein MJO52_08855 [Microbulbifer variabilis]
MTNPHNIDYTGFIFFHETTKGQNGKPVFIDPKLLPRFIDLIDINSEAGRKTANQMNQLSSTAAGITSESNQTNGFQHRENIGAVQVSYTVYQEGNSHNRGAGVYITELKRANGISGAESLPAGFYLSKLGREGWGVEPIEDDTIPTVIGAIGAEFNGTAYSAITSAKKYGKYLLTSGNANQKQLNDCFSLYYAPSYLVDELGVWKTATQKLSGPDAGPRELARLLYKSLPWDERDQTLKHHWYVFGEGAKILHRTLKEFSQIAGGKKLQQHCFYFVNPRENLGLLMREIEAVGAQTKKTSYRHSLDDIASKVHQVKDGDNAVIGLQKMDAPWSEFDKMIQGGSNYYQNKYMNSIDNNRTFSDAAIRFVRNFKEGWG